MVNKDGSHAGRKVEIGLDDNKMVRIVSGLDEGEVVLLTPPLRAGTVESGSKTADVDLPDGSGTFQQRVNQRLEEANGNGSTARPSQPGRGQSMGPGEDRSVQPGGPDVPSSDQMEQMRRRFEDMSDEERQKEREQMKRRLENMSPEEREAMRQRFQGGGGSRQGRGQRQGGSQRQGEGGQRPRGAERDQ